MKRRTIIASSVATLALAVLVSGTPDNTVMSKDAGTMVGQYHHADQERKGLQGYHAREDLHQEKQGCEGGGAAQPRVAKYFAMAKAVLEQFEGKSVTKASKMEVDGVTGATYTSKALVKNVQAGLDYYKEHK
jgi:electron transport complex protein RnfG